MTNRPLSIARRRCFGARCLLGAIVAVAALGGTAAQAEPLLTPFSGATGTPPPPWKVSGLPQQTKPFTRFSVVDIDGKRAVKIEADLSYGNLVHPVKDIAAPAQPELAMADRKADRGGRPAREARRRHRGQGVRGLRHADGQRPVHRAPAAAARAQQDDRPGADGDALLRLGREAPAGTTLDNAFTRGSATWSSSPGPIASTSGSPRSARSAPTS
jgi:hypothetical protein